MEKARLILDFLKTLIWPLLVVVVLILFHSQVKDLVSERLEQANLPGVSFTFATGSKKPDTLIATSTDKPKPPDVWFSLRDVSSLHNTTCVEQGKFALNRSGFGQIGVNPGGIAYGYDEGFVGAANCGLLRNSVLITVAGPYAGLADRHKKLEDAFFGGAP